MKIKKRIFIIFFILLSLTYTCSKKNDSLIIDSNKIAQDINNTFLQMKIECKKIADRVEMVFSNPDNYDTTTEKMDVYNNGKYKTFEDLIYYYYPENENECEIAAGFGKPINNELKKKIRLTENLDQDLRRSINSNFISRNWLVLYNDSIVLVYPQINMVSMLPAKLNFYNFSHYKLSNEKNNPEKKVLWISNNEPGEPIISYVGDGWVMGISAPVYLADSKKIFAAAITVLRISDLNKRFIESSKNMIMLLSSQSYLIGASKICRESIELKLLYYDHLKQLKDLPDVNQEFKLSHKNQDKDLQNLADRYKKESKFNIKIQDNNYFVNVVKIPKVNFYIIGLLRGDQ